MGELYNPYPKLPKNIRQVGERDQVVKLYIEDYVNTYLKRLYPAGGQDLRVGLLLGEIRTEDGVPFLFIDGAIEMEQVTKEGEKVEFTEEAWKKASQVMEQMFPHRSVQGWFLCGAPGCALSPLDYWKQHGQYFAGKNQLMYLNSGLEGDEAIYTASEDGFYKLRGYSIYYERNQMMQDYMVSRKDARRDAGYGDPGFPRADGGQPAGGGEGPVCDRTFRRCVQCYGSPCPCWRSCDVRKLPEDEGHGGGHCFGDAFGWKVWGIPVLCGSRWQ